ncbi:ABC transporter permease [Rubrimonas sp.]|uniref:ABC transporter permease n=1 Tax=Rubrimonas sp. TaxID=2036015 RepID=UPI002FDCBAA3
MSGVLGLAARRLAFGVGTLLAVSLLIFGAVELLPGDLAEQVLGRSATEETAQALRVKLGLDRPAWERYGDWLGGALRGEFGVSLTNGRAVAEQIGPRLANTLFLALYAAAIATPLALALGLMAALWRDTIFDRVANVATLTAISSPEFFLGYILVLALAVQTPLFPAIATVNPEMGFFERLHRTTLPALTLTLVVTAHMMRMTRAAVVNLLASPYIEMARLKGASPARVILRHALPNALAPIISVVALNLAYLITGVVLVEVVFAYPGVGQLLVDSVSKRDFPVVQACCLIFAATYIMLNILADLGAILSNPRLRRPG